MDDTVKSVRTFLDGVVENRIVRLSKGVEVSDFTVHEILLRKSDSRTPVLSGFAWTDDCSVGYSVFRKPCYQKGISRCVGAVTPNLHTLCRRKPVVFYREMNHARFNDSEVGDSKVGAKMPITGTNGDPSHKKTEDRADYCGYRSSTGEPVFTVDEPSLCFLVEVSFFFFGGFFLGFCGYELDHWGIRKFNPQCGKIVMSAAVVARIISFFCYFGFIGGLIFAAITFCCGGV